MPVMPITTESMGLKWAPLMGANIDISRGTITCNAHLAINLACSGMPMSQVHQMPSSCQYHALQLLSYMHVQKISAKRIGRPATGQMQEKMRLVEQGRLLVSAAMLGIQLLQWGIGVGLQHCTEHSLCIGLMQRCRAARDPDLLLKT